MKLPASRSTVSDSLGRVRTPAERREVLLDEFERSGLSGQKFAELTGLKYQTFVTGVQQRQGRCGPCGRFMRLLGTESHSHISAKILSSGRGRSYSQSRTACKVARVFAANSIIDHPLDRRCILMMSPKVVGTFGTVFRLIVLAGYSARFTRKPYCAIPNRAPPSRRGEFVRRVGEWHRHARLHCMSEVEQSSGCD